MMSDQHRADVLSVEGHPDVSTPSLDRLAARGMRFIRAYCQSGISVASRTTLFTGIYPRTTGILDNSKVSTEVLEQCVSLQEAFRQNGYTTYAFGKRHIEGKPDEGWVLCREDTGRPSTDYSYVQWIEEQGYAREFGEDWAAEFGRFPKGNPLEDTPYPTAPMGTRPTKLPADVTMEAFAARNTIEVIREHARNGKPFFCFTSFYRPHQPYTPLPQYLARHDASEWGAGGNEGEPVAMPATLHQPSTELPPLLARQRASEKGIWCLGLAAKDEQLYRDYMTAYYALVEEIDHWIGEIMRELEESGLAENTIVVYLSDHGDFVGSHGMVEKCAMGHNVYEETLRVPLLFCGSGIAAGGINSELTGLIDVYPTLADMAGLKLPDEVKLQGVSLAGALTGGKGPGREYIVSENWSQAAVITADHKLGIWLDPAPIPRDFRSFGDMLFDRVDDPAEIENVCEEEPAIVEKLRGFYKDFCASVPDKGKQQARAQFASKSKVKSAKN
jgi:arylsulfatase A-like enzyme